MLICADIAERWPSGLRRSLGKRVHGNVSGVQIPFSPPGLVLRRTTSRM